MDRSERIAPLGVAGSIMILIFSIGLDSVSAYSAARQDAGTGEPSIHLAQQAEGDRKKAAEEEFRRMCEFVELDQTRTAEALRLFEARFREINEITAAVQNGGLTQAAASEKLAESFKAYREKFERLLSAQQKAKLVEWESRPPAQNGRKRTFFEGSGSIRGDKQAVALAGMAAEPRS